MPCPAYNQDVNATDHQNDLRTGDHVSFVVPSKSDPHTGTVRAGRVESVGGDHVSVRGDGGRLYRGHWRRCFRDGIPF